MCERALIGFHLMLVRPSRYYFSMSGLGRGEGGWRGSLLHFAVSGACLHIDLRLNLEKYLNSMCLLTYTMASKIVMPHLNCMNVFRH